MRIVRSEFLKLLKENEHLYWQVTSLQESLSSKEELNRAQRVEIKRLQELLEQKEDALVQEQHPR
jgi:hypothetical protein